MFTAKNYRNERGMSTIQIAIGIMITIIMLLGAVSGYQYFSQAKVTNEIQMLSSLKVATVEYGAVVSGGSFTALNVTIPILNQMGFFKDPTLALNAAGTSVTNQWGGGTLVGFGAALVTGDSIKFTLGGVPSAACVDIATKVDNIVATVSINGTQTKSFGAATNIAKVVTQCNASASATIQYWITK